MARACRRSRLELAEDCDAPVSWSCRTGVCHRCESPMVAGEVDYAPEPLDPPAPGNTLWKRQRGSLSSAARRPLRADRGVREDGAL
jgi:hypothetical protein